MTAKPRLPQVLVFVCESCAGQHGPDYIRNTKGVCATCQGESWTLKIGYTRAHVHYSPTYAILEIMGRTLFGNKDWEDGATADEVQQFEIIYPEVTAADALTICKVRYREEYRVLEYIKYRQQLEADEDNDTTVAREGDSK
jgi:hypothetical protein